LPLAVLDENGPDVRQTPESFGNLRGKMVLARSSEVNSAIDRLRKRLKERELSQKLRELSQGGQGGTVPPVSIGDQKEIMNSIGVKLIRIPKGKFLMGSHDSEDGRKPYETQHEVTICQNFYMGATEVTQAQWQKVMGNKPSQFEGDELPVENISWDKAIEFCKRLSEMPEEIKAGRKYRLPTEAEWEYACRAGTTTPFHFGIQLNGRQANCDGTAPYGTDSIGPYLKETTVVGTYRANAWGLYDMHGNVFEWCSDWYGEYPSGSATDPSGPATGSDRVIRGGFWECYAVNCRSASRSMLAPLNRVNGVGFRLVLSLPKQGKEPEALSIEEDFLEKQKELADINQEKWEAKIGDVLDDASKARTTSAIAKSQRILTQQLSALQKDGNVREDKRQQLANRLLIMIRELERRAN
jgi:formylglycine-generating enzyme required for sulfatase activity